MMRYPGYLIYGLLLLTERHHGRVPRLDPESRQPGQERSQDGSRQSRRLALPLRLLSTLCRRQVISWLISILEIFSTR